MLLPVCNFLSFTACLYPSVHVSKWLLHKIYCSGTLSFVNHFISLINRILINGLATLNWWRFFPFFPSPIFTARVRSTTGGYVFTLFTIWGVGYPNQLTGGGGGYPIQLIGGGGVSPPQVWTGGGYPSSWWGVAPSQVWMGGVSHPADGGTPFPGGGIPHPAAGGYPIQLMGVPPSLPQHSVYLLRGGRCASCVHAGGLSFVSDKFGLHSNMQKCPHWTDQVLNGLPSHLFLISGTERISVSSVWASRYCNYIIILYGFLISFVWYVVK